MTPALEKAQATRKANKAAGFDSNKSVKFSGQATISLPYVDEAGTVTKTEAVTEVALLRQAAKRAGYTSMVEYAKEIVVTQALKDAGRPVKARVEKTTEALKAEADALLARIAKRGG